MRALEYEERLKIWDLTTLKERRERGDIIQMYKTMNGLEDIQWYTGPHYAQQTCTREANLNSHRLVGESFPTRSRNDFRLFVSVREEFFLNRTVEKLNRLTNSQIEAQSLNSFKARIDS